jgi:hypothetical protein
VPPASRLTRNRCRPEFEVPSCSTASN